MNKKEIPEYMGPETSSKKNKMTQQEILNRFNKETASVYSQRKPDWLPEFDFTFSIIIKALKHFITPGAGIIDLGAGTGNLSRAVFEKYPDVRIELVDFSQNMLNEVMNVLSEYQGKFKIIEDDFLKVSFKNNTYNCVISSFAIHHARNESIYQHLYNNIYNWLKTPGIFICCDVIEGGNDYLSSLNENGWRDFLHNRGFEEKDIEKILNNYYREDSPLSLKMHLTLLSNAGFKTTDVLWKKYNFGIYAGIK